MKSKLLKALVIAALGVYPFIIFFGLTTYSSNVIALLVLVLFSLRLLLGWKGSKSLKHQKYLGLLGIVLALLVLMRQEPRWFMYYPLLVNLSLFAAFFASLWDKQPIVETFARMGQRHLPLTARPYFIGLTKIWCAFFVVNTLISAWTIFFADLKTWTIYNGLISYLLIAALLSGEWIFRKCTKLEEKYESDNASF
ncbi:hypothetical protein M0C34_03430 [Agarivorans sp. TSD2052]|uniref:COG4648 family protein n=1 Tax=Agarivorans sp. TSD2052 TaxID=2937286 RepID=UPI00200BB02A|nr:hypothetical protein [Agarivorans sp. TSD2052]UPW19341.1 hypothetical protein M0C34_03430 [Agarivorans sp. TSD2052]